MSSTFDFVTRDNEHFVLNLDPIIRPITDDQFLELCNTNEDLRIEQTSSGELDIMPGTGGTTGRRNARLISKLQIWAEHDGFGLVFDSSTIFQLPNGAKRLPDASWVRLEKWDALTVEQQDKIPPLCPDFVAELRSRTDWLPYLQNKMEEYIANGAQLGWLIDPIDRRLYIYRPDADVEVLQDPETVSGEPVLTGFVLALASVWD
jgi:Uma2 family endonuclease